jgi:hypothetical protein
MNTTRRAVLGAGAGLTTAFLAGTNLAKTVDIPPFALDPIPPLPATPAPGKPGDFDWLAGEWRIRNRQPKPKTDRKEWIEFPGEATVRRILGGVGSVEDLRIPERDFAGMGLRLLDVEKKVWWDHWVNAKSGELVLPGVTGSFENGAGIFTSTDEENGKPVTWLGIWDAITPKSCRWRSAVTRDGAKTWEQVWIMDWTRVGP